MIFKNKPVYGEYYWQKNKKLIGIKKHSEYSLDNTQKTSEDNT
jgi:hypothetical protein